MKDGTLAEIFQFSNGKSIKPGGVGKYKAYGANGVIGGSEEFNHQDAIILGRVGAYCGAVAKCGDKFWASDNTIVVYPQSTDFNKYYAYYLLQHLNLNKYAGGAAQPLLTQTVLKQVPVRYHENEDERNLIADILSSYDALIENNNRRIAILEEMAQSLYREWFVKFRFPGHENAKFIDSPLGKIPEGWGVKSLKDTGEVVTGKTPSKKDENNFGVEVPFVKTPDMHGGVFVIETGEGLSKKGADSQKKKYLPLNSIMVSCIGTAGVVAINPFVAQTNQQINSIKLNSLNMREFLYFALLDLEGTIKNHGATGATMTNLSKGKFESLQVVIPIDSLMNKYHENVYSMFEQILTFSRVNAVLIKQRDFLLPKLMSGNVNI